MAISTLRHLGLEACPRSCRDLGKPHTRLSSLPQEGVSSLNSELGKEFWSFLFPLVSSTLLELPSP